MIRKFFFNLLLIIFLLLILIIIALSTVGVETSKFNNLISEKIGKTKNIKLELKTINYKLDLKELSFFAETKQPKIEFSNLLIPTQSVKVYVDILNLFQNNFKINKINLFLDEIDITELNKLSQFIKPSNLKSILNNRIKNGKLISEIEIFLNKRGFLKNYIVKGNIVDLEANIYNEINLSNTKFSFFADKEDILIKNIFGNIENITVKDGDIKFNLEDGLKVNSNFNTDIKLNSEFLKKNEILSKNNEINNAVKFLVGNFNNNLSLNFDNTFKLINYDYKISGNIKKSKIQLSKPFQSDLISETINEIFLKETQIVASLTSKSSKLDVKGNYSLNDTDFSKLKLNASFNDNNLDLKADLNFENSLKIDLINYEKPRGVTANLYFNLNKKKELVNIKDLKYKEKKNYIKIQNLSFIREKLNSINGFEVNTTENNFLINWNKKIQIKGNKFDARNLSKFISEKKTKNVFNDINSNIEINFNNVKVPLSENLQNFRLIGVINKGKFIKISSKGDFGGGNFLDISIKKGKDSDKRFLEVYSDLTQPLLNDYSFFKGLSGGKLTFTSLIDGSKSTSKLKIENFKVVNAPGVIKLLSLADLGGLADLAEGEGLSFDILEIDMENNENHLKLNEILALGPSVSVLMEGYQDAKGLTSLKGTLIPAKTFNKMISKIPVIGNIIIPKEVGEGLFGISFKMKGPKGKMKTTINPIRTLTPRFIQKIIDKNKISK